MAQISWLSNYLNNSRLSNWSSVKDQNPPTIYQVVILITLEIAGIAGNTLAIVMTVKMLRYKGNLPQVLILYLSLADLLTVLCSYTPSIIAQFILIPHSFFYPSHWLCQFQAFTMMTLLYYSSGMIVIMSIERLLAIKMPVWYKVNFKRKTVYIFMAITLICCVMFNLLPLFGVCQLSIHFNSTCFWDWDLTNPGTKLYSYTVVFLSIILVVAIFIINIITITIVKRKNKIADSQGRRPITESRATGVLVSTGFLFIISWLPFSKLWSINMLMTKN
ncbi:uncharacterized protein TRIADDRAFT_51529 [Trichoplax adhaerens]|uniref:G-protein coupled receptors family 1 profile domain-containing protein n=1 Tax=Trichoplax adhaerens TaxID=10228 RepID=B3RJN5_TRIAD|nr:hypothetical protein TRIADDRAFT_51529 [Trichoplax adhaerens]EDV28527.1 hypothetical protein TRIADDRAFT_51529 [Trichoplax adhaerens]|eukprot:XP_002107729.1 hypothetical protein TRIADDRAFT_51529 [Trichoplax adhaerens]